MVIVAQLVRALVCGSRGRRFEPGPSPKTLPFDWGGLFFYGYFESFIKLFRIYFWNNLCHW